jgi:DNA-binding IclR family transcriptional regulator
MNPSRTQAQEHARVERYTQRYADDRLKYRLLMRLYGARPNQTIVELAEPLRIHPSQVRRSLRTLVLDGLVSERGDAGAKTYSLSNNPSARWLVTELLRRAIESGGTP